MVRKKTDWWQLEHRTKLLVIFIVWWLGWAFQPRHFSDWVLENILTLLFVPILILARRKFQFSNLSYTLIFVFMMVHTVGAHYTYAEVPYEQWSRALGFSVNELFGFERNHFDRLVHFLYGFLLVYPVRELFVRIGGVRGAWGYYLPIEQVMAFSMVYELVEWLASLVVASDLGQAYLGTQGDEWDAQKDMGLATLGAIITMGVVAIVNWRLDHGFGKEMKESLAVKDREPLGEVKLAELKKDAKKRPK